MNTISSEQTSLIYNTDFIKPDWAPPSYLFGPVWTFLYILIFISFVYVFVKYFQKKVKFSFILPFLLNIFFNAIFTYIQFGLRNNILATIDILLVLITLVWAMKIVYKKYKWVAYIQIPYLLWVSFATVLQITITYLNW